MPVAEIQHIYHLFDEDCPQLAGSGMEFRPIAWIGTNSSEIIVRLRLIEIASVEISAVSRQQLAVTNVRHLLASTWTAVDDARMRAPPVRGQIRGQGRFHRCNKDKYG